MQIHIQTRCPALFVLIFVCAATLHSSCTQQSHGAPEGYDFKKPQRKELGKTLNEISGLSFNADSNILLGISDSKRKIIGINLKTHKLHDYAEKFWDQADFEDLVKIDETVFVLISDGTILAVKPGAKDTTGTIAYPFPSTGKNDFETLYHDPSLNALVILCKSCAEEKGQGVRIAYRFDLSGRKFDSTVIYTISSEV